MEHIRRYTPKLLDRLQPSGTAVLLGTAILIGAGTGLGAVLFIRLIDIVQSFFFEGGEQLLGDTLGRGLFIIIPTIGGLIAGPIIAFFASEAKGHGVPEVMQAIALNGGRIRPRVVVAKIAASAVCIGTGGSAGREGPIVQVGAALGSSLGQLLHLSEARIRNLVACGAAAGIAATFNAPIAGVIFAVEIFLGDLHLGDLGSVVLSSVTASVLARVFLGERPAFSIPNYGMQTPWEILLFALLGILAALAAVAFIRMLYWTEDVFDNWKFPEALKPAVGGLLLGLLAFFYPIVMGMGFIPLSETSLGFPLAQNIPHVFGAGFPVIEGALLRQLSFGLLAALVLLKPLATSLTLGSGNSGGVFAPALFTGAALGGAFGLVVDTLFPGGTAGAGAFSVVGMAAVFAGAARAPFTAILIVFEMTDDIRLIVPLMAGVVVSLIVAERLSPDSIYTLKLSRRGIHLKSGQDVDVMESVRVDEVMMSPPETIPVNLPAPLLADEFIRTGRHGFPVLDDEGDLYGIVSLEDYRRATTRGKIPADELTVEEITNRNPIVAYPDETVDVALKRMAPRDISRLPVVSRENPKKLIGVVRRNDIVRAYELGAMRREEAHRRAQAARKFQDVDAEFMDIPLASNSKAVGKRIADLSIPREAVLVSIRRGHKLVIPHGDTLLEAGDVVTALCSEHCAADVKDTLNSPDHHPHGETKAPPDSRED